MGVSKNRGTPKSSILTGFSLINHPFWVTTIFGNTHVYTRWWFRMFFIFIPILGVSWSILTNIFQIGWNHHLVYTYTWICLFKVIFTNCTRAIITILHHHFGRIHIFGSLFPVRIMAVPSQIQSDGRAGESTNRIVNMNRTVAVIWATYWDSYC